MIKQRDFYEDFPAMMVVFEQNIVSEGVLYKGMIDIEPQMVCIL